MVAPALVLVLSATGPFDGCGGTTDEARPLPRDTAGSCFDDSSCVPVGCEEVRCIAGTCQEVAPIRDADGDREAPPTCGLDCDDTNASIHPGAAELCDLVDQDCDGMVDEGAAPLAIRFETDTRDPLMISVPWGDDVLVTDTRFSPGSLLARTVSLDARTVGVSRRVLDVGDVEIVAAAGRATDDGAILALAARDAGSATEIVIVTIRRAADGAAEVVGDPTRHPVGEVTALDVTDLAGTIAVAWDDASSTRFLWSPGWAADVRVAEGLVAGLGPLDLASDGTHLVVSTSPRTLAFHGVDGALAGTQETTGELALGRPLADDADGLFAIVRDAFDHSVQRVSLGTVGALTPALDAEPSTIQFGIDRIATRLYVTRASSIGTIAGYADTSDLELYTSFDMSEVTGGGRGTVRSVTVLEVPAGPVIVTNYGETGSIFTLLACRVL